jgi:cation-transporting ATPase 13A1
MIAPYRYQGTGTICDIHHGEPTTLHPSGEISFTFQQKKYIWDEDKRQFRIILYPSDLEPRVAIYQGTTGLDAKGIKEATETYGTNR